MAKYRKKPVVIEAFIMGAEPFPRWFTEKESSGEINVYRKKPNQFLRSYCEIRTLEGIMRGDFRDFIILGVNGEVYPCKPDIFEKTYERVDE